MCCFTGPVEHVSATQIFVRGAGPRQHLVYAMSLAAVQEVAMVLPLPVPPGSAEDAVRFVDLQSYPSFFRDLDRGFLSAEPTMAVASLEMAAAPATLAVHAVGEFEASFVPAPRDFARLDPRFRLPVGFWHALPAYHDYGFAVFKLRGLASQVASFHPMAFDFPRRDPSAVFFPTVHVHDGQVHAQADFDHALYLQPEAAGPLPEEWEPSMNLAGHFMDNARAAGLVEAEAPCYRLALSGRLANQDTWVGADESPSRAHGRTVGWLPAARAQLQAALARVQSDPSAAREALRAVNASHARVEAVPALVALLDHPDRALAREAAALLDQMGETRRSAAVNLESATLALAAALREGGRRATDDALAHLRHFSAAAPGHLHEEWLAWLGHENPAVRRTMARLVAGAATLPPQAVAEAGERLRLEGDTDTRESLFRVLRGAGPARAVVRTLIDLLGDPRWGVRRLAAQSLGEMGPAASDAVPALRAMAEGMEQALRDEARAALARIEGRAGPA